MNKYKKTFKKKYNKVKTKLYSKKNAIKKSFKKFKEKLENKFAKINKNTIKKLRNKFKKIKLHKKSKKRQQIGCSSKNSVCIMKGGGVDLVTQPISDVSNKFEDFFNGLENSFMGNNPIASSEVTDQPYLGTS
jgi:hypothetical protein